MLVPERHHTDTRYRYGFNGMEKDDEVKGSGNSYDFGARMYDPRVGRWFSTDPKFFKQPGWSPYKAFYDNPLIYIDPEAETEYQITKIVDHKNKKTTILIEILDEDKLRVKRVYSDYFHKKYTAEFQDIIHNNVITIYEDGTKTSSTHKTEYSTRYTRSDGWEWMPEIPDFDLSGTSKINAEDGLVLSSDWGKDGLASGNKTGIRDAKDTDITALELLTTVVRGGELPKGFEAVQSTLENSSEIIQQYFDKNDIDGNVNIKEGKIEIKYEAESKVNVSYRQVTDEITEYGPFNAPQPGHIIKDTALYQKDVDKFHKQKEKEYQKQYKEKQQQHEAKKKKS